MAHGCKVETLVGAGNAPNDWKDLHGKQSRFSLPKGITIAPSTGAICVTAQIMPSGR